MLPFYKEELELTKELMVRLVPQQFVIGPLRGPINRSPKTSTG
jgi:hypothetical protein